MSMYWLNINFSFILPKNVFFCFSNEKILVRMENRIFAATYFVFPHKFCPSISLLHSATPLNNFAMSKRKNTRERKRERGGDHQKEQTKLSQFRAQTHINPFGRKSANQPLFEMTWRVCHLGKTQMAPGFMVAVTKWGKPFNSWKEPSSI